MSTEAAVAPKVEEPVVAVEAVAALEAVAVPKVEVDAEGVPVVEGKTAEEVKSELEKAVTQGESGCYCKTEADAMN